MKRLLTLCVVILFISIAFIPMINARVIKFECEEKNDNSSFIKNSLNIDNRGKIQNLYKVFNFWDWFLFVFLPWFYIHFPGLFNLTRDAIVLLMETSIAFVWYVLLPIWYVLGTTLGIILLIIENIIGMFGKEYNINIPSQFLLFKMKNLV